MKKLALLLIVLATALPFQHVAQGVLSLNRYSNVYTKSLEIELVKQQSLGVPSQNLLFENKSAYPQFEDHWQQTWASEKGNTNLQQSTANTRNPTLPYNARIPTQDAFNPLGVNDPRAAIVGGLLNMLLRNKKQRKQQIDNTGNNLKQ